MSGFIHFAVLPGFCNCVINNTGARFSYQISHLDILQGEEGWNLDILQGEEGWNLDILQGKEGWNLDMLQGEEGWNLDILQGEEGWNFCLKGL